MTSPPPGSHTLTGQASTEASLFPSRHPSPPHINVMFPLASDSMPWVSQGQLYKGAFWCPFCFPFAQTDVRLTVPGMTRGWHENAMRYLQANFAISDTPAALLGSGGLGQRSCQVALAMAGAGRCCSASSHLTRPHPICRGCAQNALTPNLHPSGPLTSADVQGA